MAFSPTATRLKDEEQTLLAAAASIPAEPGDMFKIELATDAPVSDLGYIQEFFNEFGSMDVGQEGLLQIIGISQRDNRITQDPGGEILGGSGPPELGDYSVELRAQYTTDASIIGAFPGLLNGVVQLLKALAAVGISYALTKITTFATSEGGAEKVEDVIEGASGSIGNTALKIGIPLVLILLLLAYLTSK